jgi:uncharacterized membrane protein YagU involved in acid resistance
MSIGAQALQLPSRNRPLPMFLATGFAVGVVDIVYAFLFYGMFGATPLRILQSIASGVLGRPAFAGGSRTAALGLLLHFFIAFSVTAFYFFLASRFFWFNAPAVVSGLCFGAGVFLFMHLVVLPLSAHAPGFLPLFPAVCEFIEHMLFVGLPIALAARTISHSPSRLSR